MKAEKRMIRTGIVMLICCGNALLPVVAAAETPAANLRYSGVYMLENICVDDDQQPILSVFCKMRVLRFFPDKTVIAGELRGIESANRGPDDPDELKHLKTRDYPKHFHFDLADAHYRGTYAAQGERLTLRLASAEDRLTVTAKITPEQLTLRSADGTQAIYQFLPIGPSAETAQFDRIVEEINQLSLNVTSIEFEIGGEAHYRLTFKSDAAGQIRKVRFTGSAPGDMNVNWLGYFDVNGQLVMADYKDCCYPETEGRVYFRNGQPVQPVAFLWFPWGYDSEKILWSRGFLNQQDEIGRRFQQDLDWFDTRIHPTLEGLFQECSSKIATEQERLRGDLSRIAPNAAAEEKAQGEKLLDELNQAAATLRQIRMRH
ncbi:hypothetical protein U14_03653 [Candidatus Moduliflexus flocculans]|uniref:Uncharacterized protein n=1 Tax=Candidatus Moduliflexus flocculans TaxID=1499966 RepID=A0A081BPT6_9BACT|nr:hypothetical protein U14_03653 [Candidatus Moduliflexus flocculans]